MQQSRTAAHALAGTGRWLSSSMLVPPSGAVEWPVLRIVQVQHRHQGGTPFYFSKCPFLLFQVPCHRLFYLRCSQELTLSARLACTVASHPACTALQALPEAMMASNHCGLVVRMHPCHRVPRLTSAGQSPQQTWVARARQQQHARRE